MTAPAINLEAADSAEEVDFLVTASSISSSNSDVDKYALTLTRYLENGIGAIKTDAV